MVLKDGENTFHSSLKTKAYCNRCFGFMEAQWAKGSRRVTFAWIGLSDALRAGLFLRKKFAKFKAQTLQMMFLLQISRTGNHLRLRSNKYGWNKNASEGKNRIILNWSPFWIFRFEIYWNRNFGKNDQKSRKLQKFSVLKVALIVTTGHLILSI